MSQWYYEKNMQRMGPVSEAELRNMAVTGTLRPGDLVWKEGMLDWTEAGRTTELFADPPRDSRRWKGDEPAKYADDDDRLRRSRSDDDDDRFRRSDPYDDDVLPRRRRIRKKSSNLALFLWIAGAFVLMAGIGVVVFFLIDANVHQGPIVLIQPGTVEGNLSPFDPDDHNREGCVCHVYTFPMVAQKTYVIDMESNEVDSYLRLEDPTGRQVAEDDDGGPRHPDSQIVYTATQTGVYRIIATTCDPDQFGHYRLRISNPAEAPLKAVKIPQPNQ